MNTYQDKKKIQKAEGAEPDTIRLGAVQTVAEDGRCQILFDGEAVASGKLYPVMNNAGLYVGDRVACLAVKGSYIVVGRYGTSDGSGGGSSGGFAGNIYTVPTGTTVSGTQPGDIVLYYEA